MNKIIKLLFFMFVGITLVLGSGFSTNEICRYHYNETMYPITEVEPIEFDTLVKKVKDKFKNFRFYSFTSSGIN